MSKTTPIETDASHSTPSNSPNKVATTPTGAGASQSSTQGYRKRDVDQQLHELREQMEQIQLNAINVQAKLEGQLQTVTEQLQAATRDGVSGSPYLRTSSVVRAIGAAMVALYIQQTMVSKKVSKLTYSKSLRHVHLIMGIGALGGIGSVQVARNLEPGPEKKKYMDFHKDSGVLMLVGLFLRIVLRFRSGIPERFPSNRPLQALENLSHRSFYALMLALPVSGLAYTYFSGMALPLVGVSKSDLEDEDSDKAQKAIDAHKKLGQFLEYVWVPFHFVSLAYHSAKGRSVIKRITPFP